MAGNNHTNVEAHNERGHRINFQHTSTDSPILPAENLSRLKEIDPALVMWVVEQTEKEATHRRKEESKINIFILIERLSGVIAATAVAIFGLALGGYLIMHNHDTAGVLISGTGLGTIVSVLVARRVKDKPDPPKKSLPKNRIRPQKT